MAETWTIKRCMDWTRDYLKDKGADRARLAAEWMLSAVTGLGRMELYMNIDRPLSRDELDLMHEYVVRRLKGEPLQYIIGNTQFRTLQIACEPGVLIPRPETEVLVEEVLNFLDAEVLGGAGGRRQRAELPWNAEVDAVRRAEQAVAAERRAREAAEAAEPSTFGSGTGEDGTGTGEPLADHTADATASGSASDAVIDAPVPSSDAVPSSCASVEGASVPARVLEIGSGTGCISLSLVSERPGLVRCVATDISQRAIELSCRNRDALGIDPIDADFRKGDLVEPVQDLRGTFDILVSNPPYIPEGVMAQIPEEVSAFEPREALVSGLDGLDLFRRIVSCAPHMLRPGGLLACELFEGSLDAAASICYAAGFEGVRIAYDLTGRPRIILARMPRA